MKTYPSNLIDSQWKAILTTSFVMNEVSSSQKAILNEYISTGKLQVINISFQDEEKIKDSSFPRSLSIADKSVLYFD